MKLGRGGRMKRLYINSISDDERGGVIVEATILFPIIIMVFAGLFLLSVYLPVRAQLQRATQYVANGMAASRSDGSVTFDENGYSLVGGDEEFANVYAAMFSKDISSAEAKKIIINKFGANGMLSAKGLSVECGVHNYVVYKEVYVTATKSIKPPVNLSLVGFPETIDMTVTSTAVVQNGDEFVRNFDLGVDFVDYLAQKAGVDLSKAMDKVEELMGWLHN